MTTDKTENRQYWKMMVNSGKDVVMVSKREREVTIMLIVYNR